jgi:hypothetical protein
MQSRTSRLLARNGIRSTAFSNFFSTPSTVMEPVASTGLPPSLRAVGAHGVVVLEGEAERDR